MPHYLIILVIKKIEHCPQHFTGLFQLHILNNGIFVYLTFKLRQGVA